MAVGDGAALTADVAARMVLLPELDADRFANTSELRLHGSYDTPCGLYLALGPLLRLDYLRPLHDSVLSPRLVEWELVSQQMSVDSQSWAARRERYHRAPAVAKTRKKTSGPRMVDSDASSQYALDGLTRTPASN